MKATEHQVVGKVLYPPQLLTSNGTRSWEDYTGRRVKHAEPTSLQHERWTLIYAEQDYDQANKCNEMMQEACSSFGIKVEDPFFCEVSGKNGAERDGKGYIAHL
jgi:hypothetical protein